MTPVPAAAEKNTKNAAAKTHKIRISGYQDIRGQEIRRSGYQGKKKTSSNILLLDVFRRGEKFL
jgi:hypothetical protein